MDKLPLETLVSIFKHLSQKDLISVSEVCLLYSEVVGKFDLIKTVFFNSDESSPVLTRKYSKAVINRFKPAVHEKFLENIGCKLNSLKICHSSSLNLIDIQKILQIAPNVKHLTFDYVRLEDDSIDEKSELPHLSDVTLQFHESDPKIFKILKKSSFNKIDMRFYADYPYSNFKEYVEFLKTQHKLTSFSIRGLYESNLFLIPMGKSPYQLKEFFVENCDFEEWQIFESYLVEHSKSLEKLSIKEIPFDPSAAVTQCSKLKYLEIHGDLAFITTMNSVEELKLHTSSVSLNLFPNVKKLFLKSPATEINRVLSTFMTKLQNLDVLYEGLEGIEVPKLTTLRVTSFGGNFDPNFFVIHNRIETLDLMWIYNITDELLTAITRNLTNLKFLNIHGDNHLTANAYCIVRDNCKNLKVFEFAKWNQKFTNNEHKVLYDIIGLKVYPEIFD